MRPSKQTAQAAEEHKQEESSLNLNFSLQACWLLYFRNSRGWTGIGQLRSELFPFSLFSTDGRGERPGQSTVHYIVEPPNGERERGREGDTACICHYTECFI